MNQRIILFHVKKEYTDIPTLLNFGEFQRNEGMGQMMIWSQAKWQEHDQ
jgi:hypothetical protein